MAGRLMEGSSPKRPGLIPDGALRLYEGKTHEGAIVDKWLPQDVLEFARGTRADTATT